MKKILTLTLHYTFFITALLYLPQNISIYLTIFLISTLTLNKTYYQVLPMIIVLFLEKNYIFIIITIFILNILLSFFIKKNRYYALSVFSIHNLICFILLNYLDGFNIINLQITLFLFVIYAIICALHNFQIIENKKIIIPYNEKLIYLILLLTYLIVLIKFNQQQLIPFLFMQLYIINDYKYKIFFTIIYSIYLLFNLTTPVNIIYASTVSFIPLLILILLDYKNIISLIIIIYTTIITIINLKEKRISFDNDYINYLFKDFNRYIDLILQIYNKENTTFLIQKEKINEYNEKYCKLCFKRCECKDNLYTRYAFIKSAINGSKENIYNCPNYNKFLVCDIKIKPSNLECSGIKILSEELSYIYNQSLLLKKEYETLLKLLTLNNYKPLGLDIHLSSQTLYFTIKLAKEKPIIEALLIKLAYKAFGEELELKTITEDNIYILHFFKKTKLKITYAHTILPKNKNLISGDNYYIKKDYNSSYIFALSDGMGSGYKAYFESREALKIISILTSYHFSIKTILHLLEDLYNLKANYDHYATLDLLYINTALCKANLYKLGSTTTYILHNNQLYTYENKALPLKLDEVNSTFEIDIYSGDYIFLLSDGISDFISKDEFYSLIKNTNLDTDKLCNTIIQYIKKKQKNELKDDLSLITIKAI